MPRRRDWLLRRGPFVVAGITAVVSGSMTLLRYLTYHAPAYDLGFFQQVTHESLHGHLFASSFVPYSFLGQHWEPLLGVFAQLDRLVPTPIWLLGIQALALAAAALAAARLAAIWLPDLPSAPLLAAVAMACSPLLANAAAFDYHTEALTPAVALAALEAAARGKSLRFILLLLLLATIKEDALLVAAGVGWISWRAQGGRLGLVATGVGIGAFLIIVGLVMPFFRGGAPSDLGSRYSWLTDGQTSVGAIVVGVLVHPAAVLRQLLSANALAGWALAIVPLALLPLLSGWSLLAPLLVLLVPLLSSDPLQATLHLHYGLEAAPLLLACALLGWRALAGSSWVSRVAAAFHVTVPAMGMVLIAASAIGYVTQAPLPGGMRFRIDNIQGMDRRPDVEPILGLIPADAEVSASTGLVAHLSDRAHVWEFPGGLGATYVVLDADGPISSQALTGYARARDQLSAVGYQVVAQSAGVTLWER